MESRNGIKQRSRPLDTDCTVIVFRNGGGHSSASPPSKGSGDLTLSQKIKSPTKKFSSPTSFSQLSPVSTETTIAITPPTLPQLLFPPYLTSTDSKYNRTSTRINAEYSEPPIETPQNKSYLLVRTGNAMSKER